MKCIKCGKDTACCGGEGIGEDGATWRRWYCDWRKGCGFMWEFGDDGSGFYQQLAMRNEDFRHGRVELDGELLIFDEVEI